MSSCIVEVCLVEEIKKHSNADKLDIAVIKGWQCIVKKDSLKANDKVVYFPPDTVIPKELTDRFKITNYCQEKPEGMRIYCARLRGEPSFGFVCPIEVSTWNVGDNVAEHYKATKYIEPVKQLDLSSCIIKNNPLFPTYTEIENLRNFSEVFAGGEIVSVTEKIHGTNCRVGIIEGKKVAGSSVSNVRKMNFSLKNIFFYFLNISYIKKLFLYLANRSKSHFMYKINKAILRNSPTNIYWYPHSLECVQRLLRGLSEEHRVIVLFGEVFGRVQSLKYNKNNELDFRAFDIYMDGKYVDTSEFKAICNSFGVPTVPIIAEIPYNLEAIKKLSEGTTLVNGATHIREGVVVKPLVERFDSKIKRVVLKYVSDSYLLGKYEE